MILDFVTFINDILWSVWVLIPLMIFVGSYYTIRTKGIQFRGFPDMIKAITKNGNSKSDAQAISSLEAFIVGLASRVGTGNLAGVALAIAVGGAGSIFWMWLVALIGSASAFAESSLAQLFKVRDAETKFRGGPAYYMRDAIGSKKMGIAFAILISLCFGLIFNAVQANTIAGSINNTLGVTGSNATIVSIIVGLVLAAITSYVLFKGAHTITKVTKVIVPIMAISYVILAFIIIILNITLIDDVFTMIIAGALNPTAAVGGISGAMINGMKRGLFSNEAGMGSAPNAAASADAAHPVLQGLIQTLGVFVDTIIICSATGFIILISGIDLSSTTDGIALTGNALSAILGDWSLYYLTFAVFCFAFSSILGNFYYAQSNIEFISENPLHLRIFKGVVILLVFLGSIASSTLVWSLADVFMGLMAILNLIAIIMLSKYVILLLNDYQALKASNSEIVFDSSKYIETEHLEIWNKTQK